MSDTLKLQNPTSIPSICFSDWGNSEKRLQFGISYDIDNSALVRVFLQEPTITALPKEATIHIGSQDNSVHESDEGRRLYLEKQDSREKLEALAELPRGWNGYDADPIPDLVIRRAIKILGQLEIQPEIYPTGRGSVQFEYDDGDRSLEIEIFFDTIEYLEVKSDGEMEEWEDKDINSVFRNVTRFYASA